MAIPGQYFTWPIPSRENIEKMLAEARRIQFNKYLTELENDN